MNDNAHIGVILAENNTMACLIECAIVMRDIRRRCGEDEKWLPLAEKMEREFDYMLAQWIQVKSMKETIN